MNRNKGSENEKAKKENGESKIPKSFKFAAAKEKSSRVLVEKKTVESCKTTVTMHSSKEKQIQTTYLQKNVKPVSVVRISKDVMKHLQTENLKTNSHTNEYAAEVPFLEKENITKRVPLKEKSSQNSQKQHGGLQKKTSASDLKKCATFGGMKLTAKRSTCPKTDGFEKLKKEMLKNCQNMPPTGLKTTDSTTVIGSKNVERSNVGSSEKTSTNEAESSKATLKETAFKNPSSFGGICFAPKWQSTPLKPDLFENMQEEFKHGDKELFPADSSKWLEKTPEFTKVNIREKTEIETITVTVDKTVQSPTKETEYVTTASIVINENCSENYTTFPGIRLQPKRKSTHQKPDIFENLRKESKNDDQEMHPSGKLTGQMKISSHATKKIIKTETTHVETLMQPSTQKAVSSETVSITIKEVVPKTVPTFAGLRLKPKPKNPRDIFEAR